MSFAPHGLGELPVSRIVADFQIVAARVLLVLFHDLSAHFKQARDIREGSFVGVRGDEEPSRSDLMFRPVAIKPIVGDFPAPREFIEPREAT